MNRVLLTLTILIFICFNSQCTSTQKFVLAEPQADKSLVVGAILVENVGLEDVYEAKKANIVVTIVGKSIEAGKESTEGYRVKTNGSPNDLFPEPISARSRSKDSTRAVPSSPGRSFAPP